MLARSQQRLAPAAAAGQQSCAQGLEHPGTQQRRLADPGRAEDPDDWRLHQPCHKVRYEPLASAEVLRVRAIEEREPLERAHIRHLTARLNRVQRNVLLEDRALQFLQRTARLEPKLIAQQFARLSVNRERVSLPARSVQRHHQLPP